MKIASEILTSSLIHEMVSYFKESYEEYPDGVGYILDPNWDTYYLLQQADMLNIFTIRDDSKLIGYAFVIIAGSLHSRDRQYASIDTVYLDKAYRGKFLGIKLFKFIEASLEVDALSFTLKEYNNWGKILERLGYSHTEVVYQKRIR